VWLFYQWEPRGGLDQFTAVNTGISNKLGIGLGDFHFYFVAGP
jgi:hypothetical protein